MTKIRKLIGRFTAFAMILTLFNVSAYAFGGSVALRSLSFTVGGQAASVQPVDGDEVNVNVVFDNSSGALVKRTIILAAYDADGVLQQLTANNADVAVGESIVSGSELEFKSGIASVKALIWESGKTAVPVYTRSFTHESRDELIEAVSAVINGTAKSGRIDADKKEIITEIPVYDENGSSVKTGSFDVTITVNREIASIADADGEFVKSGKSFTKTIDFSEGGRSIFVTADAEAAPVVYKLVADRTIEENFESGFEGEFKGNEKAANVSSSAYEGTWKVSGDERKYWFNASAETNTGNDPDGEYASAMQITTVNADDVKTLNDSKKVLSKGITQASGKVLMLNKPSNGNDSTSANNFGQVYLRVGTASRLSKAQDSTHFTVEYDTAYGTGLNDSEKAGRTGALTAGAYILGGGSNMTRGGRVLARLSGVNDIPTDESRFMYQAGAQSTGYAQSSSEDMSQWRHVKVEIERQSADSSEITVKTYYDGVLQSKVYSSANAEEYNDGTLSPNWVWPDQVALGTASSRSCQVYFDNLKISYDMPGNYTDKPRTFKSLKIADKYIGSVDKNVITVDIPVYDENGDAITINPSWITEIETSDSSDEVRVGETALSGENVKTGVVDYTNGGFNISINDNTYKLVINRTMNENFENGAEGSFGGFTANTNWNGGDGSVDKLKISGNERKYWFSAIAQKGKKDSDGSYLAQKSISFADSSDVKNLSDSSAVMSVGMTEAGGKVLKIDNPTNGNAAGVRDDYGTIGFAIGTSSRLKSAGASNAAQISFEYDIAYGNDSGNSGVISAFMNGAYIGSGSNYGGYTTLLSRNGGTAVDKIEATQKHTYQAGENVTNDASSATADISRWRHVKTVFSRPSADSSDITIEFYYDGEKQSKTWKTDKWPDQLAFRGATNRACQIYVDNIKITWDMPGDYRTSRLTGFNVDGAETAIGNTVTVTLPLYNNNGSRADITALTTTASGKNGTPVLYKSSADTEGITLNGAAEIDWSQIESGAKIVCGDAEYVLKTEYRLYDNFDDKTLISGQSELCLNSEGAPVWATPLTLKGKAAEDKVYSIGINTAYKAAAANKAEHAQNIKTGVYPVSSAMNTDKSAPMEAADGAAPSGNGFKLLKGLAYKGADSYASFFTIQKLDGFDEASDMSIEFDMAYDYSEVVTSFEFADGKTDLTAGNTVAGLQLANAKQRICGSGNNQLKADSVWSDTRKNEKLDVFGTKAASLDKWNHIRLEITRDAGAESGKVTAYVNGNLISETDSFLWPSDIMFQTSTFRACAVWIDNLDIRYNLN